MRDQAEASHELSRKAWKSPKQIGGLGLGIAGAAFSLATLNPVPALIAALAAVVGMLPDKDEINEFSYLFEGQRKLD